jgi:hypothetical protein
MGYVPMLRDDYLDDCRWAISEIQRIEFQMLEQAADLEDFVTGRRQSRYPLGIKFLRSLGEELDEFRKQLEYRLTGMA